MIGVVHLRDLLDTDLPRTVLELVGEIYDETDRDILSVDRHDDGSMTVPGRFPSHDLIDLGVHVPDGDYATLAGFLLSRLQRVPTCPGDTVELGPWRFEVLDVRHRTIAAVRIVRADAGPPTAGPNNRR